MHSNKTTNLSYVVSPYIYTSFMNYVVCNKMIDNDGDNKFVWKKQIYNNYHKTIYQHIKILKIRVSRYNKKCLIVLTNREGKYRLNLENMKVSVIKGYEFIGIDGSVIIDTGKMRPEPSSKVMLPYKVKNGIDNNISKKISIPWK